MNFVQLRCFLAVADELHFGRAARRLDMLPASLGRHLKLLEDYLGTPLIARTTRNVALTDAGASLVEDARELVEAADRLENRFRESQRQRAKVLRVGAIDSVAAGLLPQLLHDFRNEHPGVGIELLEQKTIRLLPKLLTGRIDVAFVRPPELRDPKLIFKTLFSETAVVAMRDDHRLATRSTVAVHDMADEPLIVPDRRSRPHSHDLTMKLFLEAGLAARVAQIADEKQTIVNLVSTGIGLAIVPRWASRLAVAGVRFIPLAPSEGSAMGKLALAAAWVRGTRDQTRDNLMKTLDRHISRYEATA